MFGTRFSTQVRRVLAASAMSVTGAVSAAWHGPVPLLEPAAPEGASDTGNSQGRDEREDLSTRVRRHFEKEARADAYKKHFSESYNAVANIVKKREEVDTRISESQSHGNSESGADAHQLRRLRISVARVLMERLGYSKEDLDVIGDDSDRMQGTGNPFLLADLSPGEIVLDLGSGFGVDAILAGSKVGENGRVVGVDLSLQEVSDANKRVLERGIKNVRFYNMDIERLSAIPDGSIDCVISNGGFCLVPNKRRAFREILRVLKPQGRFSIACTTLRRGYGHINKFMTDEAEQSAERFPSCMEVFMPLDAAEPMLVSLGFEDVKVDDSNSEMSVWADVERDMRDTVDAELAKDLGVLPDASEVMRQEEEDAALIAKLANDSAVKYDDAEKSKSGNTQGCPSFDYEITLEEERQQMGGFHSGESKYSHLSALSMDDICARVVLYGVKPAEPEEKLADMQDPEEVSV